MTHDLIKQAATQFANEIALATHTKQLTYKALDSRVDQFVAVLHQTGVKPGQVVALWFKNDFQLIILLHALLRLGAIACPINPGVPDKQVRTFLDQIEADVFITAEKNIRLNLRPEMEQVSLTEIQDKTVSVPEKGELASFDLSRPATLVFTSGSSGEPRAALHSYANHYYSALGSNENIPLRPGDRWLLSLPLYHVGGLAILFRCALAGATVLVQDGEKDLSQAVNRLNPTHLSLVGTQLQRLIENPQVSWQLVKVILLGGGPVSPKVIKQARDRQLPILMSYGSTEMASQVATTRLNEVVSDASTTGPILPYRHLEISPEGEILVRGETLFLGYYEQGRINRPLDSMGQFKTGDLGRMDAEGRLQVLGRLDNMFISGGENIQPEEIEACLMTHPSIEKALVVPIKNREFGARPVAFIAPTSSFDPKQLVTHLRRNLPGYKVPDHFFLWPTHLKTNSLKLSRPNFQQFAEEIMRRMPFKSHICPLCDGTETSLLLIEQGRDYWRCHECRLTFLPPQYLPDPLTEKKRYELHQNSLEDAGYRQFLMQLVEPLLPRLQHGASGLDYGAGNDPALAALLTEHGFHMDRFDSFFWPDPEPLKRQFDFITCCETIEHFFVPLTELGRFDRILKPGGWIAIMTQIVESDRHLPGWWYLSDFTHVRFYGQETFAWIADHFGWKWDMPAPNVVLFNKPKSAG